MDTRNKSNGSLKGDGPLNYSPPASPKVSHRGVRNMLSSDTSGENNAQTNVCQVNSFTSSSIDTSFDPGLNTCDSFLSSGTDYLLDETLTFRASSVKDNRTHSGSGSAGGGRLTDAAVAVLANGLLKSTSSSTNPLGNPTNQQSSFIVEHRDPGKSCGPCCRRPCSGLMFCGCVSVIVLTVITAAFFAFYTVSSPKLRPNMTTVEPVLRQKRRCFDICEPDDVRFRDDKLMKPVIVHDGIKPITYFLYQFPHEPKFGPEVGDPAYLTPYIRRGKLQEGRDRAKVKGLPWPKLESYAGFLTISEQYGSHLYFWFFPSKSDPSKDPVILWLQGGPGATSLFGLFKENGPIKAFLGPNGPQSELNPYSWNRNASVLYVDNPVGAGFSYTSSDYGYPNYVNESSDDLFIALQQFFTLWSDYAERDLYIFGESYGGKYIPALSHRIHLSKTVPEYAGPVDLNLKGLGIGNGWMSPADQGKYASYLYFHGLLDRKQYQTLVEKEESLIAKILNEEWFESWRASDNQLHFILESLNYTSLYDLTRGQYRPNAMDFWHWMQQPHIRKAMNLGNRSMSDGVDIYRSMIEDTMQSIKPELAEAIENYKVLIYHGSLDIICHYPGAEETLSKTNWTTREAFENSQRTALWFYNEEIAQRELAGYLKHYGNLSFVLIRNAGHSVPVDQPQWALRMVEGFITGALSTTDIATGDFMF
ncbi:venom serine carboxypeptidase-like [Tigriopus californicus]|uniref:venom serine carboxypeptidase-like n=1 Tax=Tigriopus californicus TaxID=6832 RepID=UPI0027DA8005|nr:venom serine carboxypeptidase-like [Tigriopus californicus]XP_059087438.1 venom serine carboxypeptidase-like [Tigriopus californicus]